MRACLRCPTTPTTADPSQTRTVPQPSSPPRALRSAPHPARSARPRSAWRWALAGALAGALGALVLFAPAHWLAAALAAASQDRVLLHDARGTLWNGSAQLLLTGGSASRDRAALPGRIDWQLRPQPDGLRLQLQAACCTAAPLRARLQLRPSGIWLRLADGQSQWPAALLSGLGTPWNTLQLQGQLALQTQALELHWAAGRMLLAGQARLDAQAMSSRLSTLRPMGSYRLELQGGEVPTLELSTLDGALQLSGSGHWVGQRLRFAGQASAGPDREAALSNLLNIIGQRNGARSIISVG